MTEATPPQESSSPSESSNVEPNPSGLKPKDAVELSREAMAILQHRMLTEPEDIPSGALLKFLETQAKLELARLAGETPQSEEDQSVAQIVAAAAGLPEQRRRQVLVELRRRSRADVQLVDTELAELDTEKEG